ncbi:Uncharacterised protein [uncultured archaeon]|nr:Uncharacterised protein [uncultured archaeon]
MDLSLVRLFFGICLIAAMIVAISAGVDSNPAKQVLILASYHPGLAWEDDIISEIRLHFAMFMPSTIVSCEYMDTKRVAPDETRLSKLKALYLEKYGKKHLDLIIASDTDAFDFLLVNRDEVFPGTPVVFCGVVYFDDKMLQGKRGFTGVVEKYDIADTISLMLRLHPGTQHIAIVNDMTATGQAAAKVLEDTIPLYRENVTFEILGNLSIDELKEKVSFLSNDSLILLLTFIVLSITSLTYRARIWESTFVRKKDFQPSHRSYP